MWHIVTHGCHCDSKASACHAAGQCKLTFWSGLNQYHTVYSTCRYCMHLHHDIALRFVSQQTLHSSLMLSTQDAASPHQLAPQSSGLMPPLLSASVHSQQHSAELAPEPGCTARFLVHASGSSPPASSEGHASSPSHPCFSYSNSSTPLSHGICSSLIGRGSAGSGSAALPASDSAEGLGPVSFAAGEQYSQKQQCSQETPSQQSSSQQLPSQQPPSQQPCSQQLPAQHHSTQGRVSPTRQPITSAPSDTLHCSSAHVCDQQQQQRRDMLSGSAASSRSMLAECKQPSSDQHQESVSLLAVPGRESLPVSRPWSITDQYATMQHGDALSVLNSADLAFLASRSASSEDSGSSASDGEALQHGALVSYGGAQPSARETANSSVAVSALPRSSLHAVLADMQLHTQDDHVPDQAGSCACDQLQASSAAQTTGQEEQASDTHWQNSQRLGAQCNGHTCLGEDSVDSLYCDEDWELHSNVD